MIMVVGDVCYGGPVFLLFCWKGNANGLYLVCLLGCWIMGACFEPKWVDSVSVLGRGMWFVAWTMCENGPATTWLMSHLSPFLSSPCSECVSMMLLPSGRSNSDVYPLQNAANTTATPPTTTGAGAGGGGAASKPLLLTRTSSPQLTTTTALPTTNGSIAHSHGHATPTRSNGCPQSLPGIPAIAPLGAEATQGTELVTGNGNNGSGTNCGTGIYGPILGQSHGSAMAASIAGNWPEIDGHLEAIQEKLKPGWSVHAGKEGRLYYCKWVSYSRNY